MREWVEILGAWVDRMSVDELHAKVLQMVRGGGHALVPHVNIHSLNLIYNRPWLRDLLNSASVVFYVTGRESCSRQRFSGAQACGDLVEKLRQGLMYTGTPSYVPGRSSRSPVFGDYGRALVSCVFES